MHIPCPALSQPCCMSRSTPPRETLNDFGVYPPALLEQLHALPVLRPLQLVACCTLHRHVCRPAPRATQGSSFFWRRMQGSAAATPAQAVDYGQHLFPATKVRAAPATPGVLAAARAGPCRNPWDLNPMLGRTQSSWAHAVCQSHSSSQPATKPSVRGLVDWCCEMGQLRCSALLCQLKRQQERTNLVVLMRRNVSVHVLPCWIPQHLLLGLARINWMLAVQHRDRPSSAIKNAAPPDLYLGRPPGGRGT